MHGKHWLSRRVALLIAIVITGARAAPLGDTPDSVLGAEAATAALMSRVGNHAMGSQILRIEGRNASAGSAQIVLQAAATVAGMDVSSYQGSVDWSTAYGNGARFAYVKATESTGYTNPDFAQQYNGSYNVGMIRGAYHFAVPSSSTGAAQANYFVDQGGGWSADGKTLPGALDMEYNPYGATCYGLSQSEMASWVTDFSNTYYSRTGRYPVIYTSQGWWSQCVGSAGNYSSTSPLWVAAYSSSVGTLPYAWAYYTFWQFDDAGTFPGDKTSSMEQSIVFRRWLKADEPLLPAAR